MRKLLILIAIIFLTGFSTKIAKPKLDLVHIDMSDKTSVLSLVKKAGMSTPVPFDNKKLELRAKTLCKQKQENWRSDRFRSWPDVNMILYGKHSTKQNIFMCLPDKLTKNQMKFYCKIIKRKLYEYDTKNHSKFSCIKKK